MFFKDSSKEDAIVLAHISDLHVGSQYFVPDLMEGTIDEINELNPEFIIATGDLTSEGFKQEYEQVKKYFDEFLCGNLLVVPGNHDSRHVGYQHFEDLIGKRDWVIRYKGMVLVGGDSSEPDLDSGRIGRERSRWIEENFKKENGLKIFVLHHHLIPVPATGRERNIAYDAGDVLEMLINSGVDLVLTGHKHVPFVWKIEDLFVVNAGTASSLRLRGRTKPCYNILEIRKKNIKIFRKYINGSKDLIIDFTTDKKI